ncbi:metal-sensitive transcriptional regulator [Streptomyces jeddahensis]|uniref:Copper-sensing transcriptional repressor CsoR n=1 Tax=Streptomyces jeddahensis TaxID=1716141 RepID=A0A177HQP3_9ACTN|nr:metal-sensitive transcriptional regulator [Streptomyces jeddahensis]OAH13332.1 copper-sensing transcriptional repressor CsoR [Streptomyces jeddahensis]
MTTAKADATTGEAPSTTTAATDATEVPGVTDATAASGQIVTDHDRGIHGYHKQKEEHLKRLRRIEGQIRGLQRMVDEDVYCIDILTQVSASTKALQSFALQLLEEHLRHCVADAALKGGEEIDAKVEEATKAIARLLRT